MADENQKVTEVLDNSEMWDEDEQKKEPDATKDANKNKGEKKQGKDFWDRVADDVASGYKSKEDDDNILNVDQEPGDHEPGDKNPD